MYFLSSGEPLVLAIGSYESVMAPATQETFILLPDADVAADSEAAGVPYRVEIRPFDPTTDVFPPIARAGGYTSQVARSLADVWVLSLFFVCVEREVFCFFVHSQSYLRVKKWDRSTFQIGARVGGVMSPAKKTVGALNEKLRVEERVQAVAAAAATTVQAIDERHQISRRLSDTQKTIEETYYIRKKTSGVVQTVTSHEVVQTVTGTVSAVATGVGKAVGDVARETQQLVSEKQAVVSKLLYPDLMKMLKKYN